MTAADTRPGLRPVRRARAVIVADLDGTLAFEGKPPGPQTARASSSRSLVASALRTAAGYWGRSD